MPNGGLDTWGLFLTVQYADHTQIFKTRQAAWSTAPRSAVAHRPRMAPPGWSKAVRYGTGGFGPAPKRHRSLSSASTRRGLSSRALKRSALSERVGLSSKRVVAC